MFGCVLSTHNKRTYYVMLATRSCCGSGNAHLISIGQVSSHIATLQYDPSAGLNYTRVARAGTVACPAGNAKFAGVDNAGVDNAARYGKGGHCKSGQISTIWQGWTLQEWTYRHDVAIGWTLQEWTIRHDICKGGHCGSGQCRSGQIGNMGSNNRLF